MYLFKSQGDPHAVSCPKYPNFLDYTTSGIPLFVSVFCQSTSWSVPQNITPSP